jgi:hypothetical protein
LRRAGFEALGKNAPTGPIFAVRAADLEMKYVWLAQSGCVLHDAAL